MANKGSWSASDASSEIVESNEYRGSVIVQLQSGDPTSVAFGEDAVFGEGIQLISSGDFIKMTGYRAGLSINAICDSGNTSNGGYQEI